MFYLLIGYAGSNCPIEGYNSTVKEDFTEREKYHMLPALELFEKICKFESEKDINIQNFVKPTKKLLNASAFLNVVSLKKETASGFNLKLKDPTRSYRIYLEDDCPCKDCTNCSCLYFLDRGICKHL